MQDEETLSQEVERGLGILEGHFELERKEARNRREKIAEWRDNVGGSMWGNKDESMLQNCAVALEEAAGFASTLGSRREELIGEIESVVRARKEHMALIAAARSPPPLHLLACLCQFSASANPVLWDWVLFRSASMVRLPPLNS